MKTTSQLAHLFRRLDQSADFEEAEFIAPHSRFHIFMWASAIIPFAEISTVPPVWVLFPYAEISVIAQICVSILLPFTEISTSIVVYFTETSTISPVINVVAYFTDISTFRQWRCCLLPWNVHHSTNAVIYFAEIFHTSASVIVSPFHWNIHHSINIGLLPLLK